MNILLRARYVATDLVTSQNFQTIRCAFMLYQVGRTRNVYAATRFILLSSTAASSATSGYVAVPQHFLQNDEPSVNNVERAGKRLVSFRKWIKSMQQYYQASNYDFLWLC